jgi:hypothetical protein
MYYFLMKKAEIFENDEIIEIFQKCNWKNDNSCYSKANRRIITPTVAASRFGDGPPDYYIVRSGKQIIIALPRDNQSEDDEEESDEDEENYKEVSILEAKAD